MRKIVYLSLVMVFFACNGSKYDKQVKTLDSLKTETEKAKSVFEGFDTLKMQTVSKSSIHGIKALQEVYQPDSIDMRMAGLINYYKSFKKANARFTLQRARVKSEIPYTLKQLASLITDLKNNALKEEEANKYYHAEREAAIKLIETIKFMKSETDKAYQNFDSVNVVFNHVLDSLKSDSLNIQSIRLKKLKSTTKKGK